jgi:hypothetical protein
MGTRLDYRPLPALPEQPVLRVPSLITPGEQDFLLNPLQWVIAGLAAYMTRTAPR